MAPRVAVVLSSGRTGTQFLARYFDANFDHVIARHEPSPSRLFRILSNARVAGAVDPQRLRSALVQFRARRVESLRERADLYLESNGLLYAFVDLMTELWPDLSVVHVVRDPRDAIRSALGHGNDRGLKRLAGAIVPHWLPDPRRTLGIERPLTLVERYAVAWAVINRTIQQQGGQGPHYLRVRFEELVDERASGLQAICAHLELPFRDEDGEGGGTDARVSPHQRFNASRHEAASWTDWSPGECRTVQELCGELMQEYGYGGEPEWRAKLETT